MKKIIIILVVILILVSVIYVTMIMKIGQEVVQVIPADDSAVSEVVDEVIEDTEVTEVTDEEVAPADDIDSVVDETVDDVKLPQPEMSFDHVAPGEYSEVNLTITDLEPEETVTATLEGPSVDDPEPQAASADEDGVVDLTWKITSYGEYTADVAYEVPREEVLAEPIATDLSVIVK